jgi:sec-independent protein translocase protein TatA
MFQTFGLPEILAILAIILLLFGVGRVSRIGEELGSAISAFRKGLNEGKETKESSESNHSDEA